MNKIALSSTVDRILQYIVSSSAWIVFSGEYLNGYNLRNSVAESSCNRVQREGWDISAHAWDFEPAVLLHERPIASD